MDRQVSGGIKIKAEAGQKNAPGSPRASLLWIAIIQDQLTSCFTMTSLAYHSDTGACAPLSATELRIDHGNRRTTQELRPGAGLHLSRLGPESR